MAKRGKQAKDGDTKGTPAQPAKVAKPRGKVAVSADAAVSTPRAARPSALVDTRVIYCGDNLEQLKKLPNAYVDLIYIDPPFNSNRNYEVFWGEPPRKEKR